MAQQPRRLAVFAFGTRGDVLPVAVVASALAGSDPSSVITFITHEAHRNMEPYLLRSGVTRFLAVSAPPVVAGRTWEDDDKAARETQFQEDCISAMDSVMRGGDGEGGVVINMFALEGWHLAELYRMPCAVLAPYVVPYSAPAAFERRFKLTHPGLYRRLKEAAPGEVGWAEVTHWMWPLFTDRWASWRTNRLRLSACPLTDPVTDLPLVHEWPRASPLLYGFSPQVVECPAYWPRSVRVCGFWFAPLEWEVRDVKSELMALPQAMSKTSSNAREVPSEPFGRNSISSCISEELKFSTHTGRVVEVLENQLTAKRFESSNVQYSSPPAELGRSDVGELRCSDDGVYDSSVGSCRVAMDDGYIVKSQEKPDLTEALNENAHTLGNFQAGQKYHLDDTETTSYTPPVKLSRFLSDHRDPRPIFVGLSSVGSMGFLLRPDSLLLLLEAVLETSKSSAVLLTAGHPPLDLAVKSHCVEKPPMLSPLEAASPQGTFATGLEEGLCCFNGRLFSFSGSVPYAWLLPECSMALHHGGSGTTAACLRAGIPQIICPFVLDQFYWAERMAWLGLAPQPLIPGHLMPEDFQSAVKRVADAVKEAGSGEMKRCAREWRARIEGEDGIGVAVGLLKEALWR